MSRIGNKLIQILAGVNISVDIKSNVVTVKGPKGQVTQKIDPDITLKIDGNILTVERPTEQKRHKALHGLSRSLINNMVIGTSQGFKISQELVGVGYRASNKGQLLELSLGYSHDIVMEIPSEITLTTETLKGQPPRVFMESADKQLIGMIAAKIRSLRAPEPYKGKGVRFAGEQVRRKAGKSAGGKKK